MTNMRCESVYLSILIQNSRDTAMLTLILLLQLELQSQEMLAKHWRHLAKKEAKAAKAAKEAALSMCLRLRPRRPPSFHGS